jgi:hypothetical protein
VPGSRRWKIRKRIVGSRSSWFAIFGKKPTFVPYGTPYFWREESTPAGPINS